jgi:hypothetical protein
VEKVDGAVSYKDDICRSLRSSLSCITRLITGSVSSLDRVFNFVKNSSVVPGSIVRIIPLSPFILSVANQPVGISNPVIPYLGFIYFPLMSCLNSELSENVLILLLLSLLIVGLALEILKEDGLT